MGDNSFTVSLTLADGDRMNVDLGGIMPDLVIDDGPAPEHDTGPSATQLLAASVASCLGSSMLYCLRRSRATVQSLVVDVTGHTVRNDRGRPRIAGLTVTLRPGLPADEHDRLIRCISIFEDYCVVSESVRRGIPIEIEVVPAAAAPEHAGAAAGAALPTAV